MKYAHSAKLTVFSDLYENSEEILNSFISFFPFNLEENKIGLKKSTAQGFNESKIKIFEVVLAKSNLISQFLEKIMENINAQQKQLVIGQAESRLDEDLNFFLRFDKEAWISDRKLFITDSGRCFHLKISIAAFPKKREIALQVVRKLFSG